MGEGISLRFVANMIGKSELPADIETLFRMDTDRDGELSLMEFATGIDTYALGALPDDTTIDIYHTLRDNVKMFDAREAAKRARAAKQSLMKGLQDPDPAVRAAAMRWVSNVPEPEQAALIRAGLTHSDPAVRAVAMQGVEAVPAPERAARVLEGLNDSDAEVRGVAAEKMLFVHPSDMPTVIWAGLAHFDPFVREAAARWIRFVSSPFEWAALVAAGSTHPDSRVRQITIWGVSGWTGVGK